LGETCNSIVVFVFKSAVVYCICIVCILCGGVLHKGVEDNLVRFNIGSCVIWL